MYTVKATWLGDDRLSRGTSIDPDENAKWPLSRIQDRAGDDNIIHSVHLNCAIDTSASRLPDRISNNIAIAVAVFTNTINSDIPFCFIQRPMCNERGIINFLSLVAH